jgi:hypothetical protein
MYRLRAVARISQKAGKAKSATAIDTHSKLLRWMRPGGNGDRRSGATVLQVAPERQPPSAMPRRRVTPRAPEVTTPGARESAMADRTGLYDFQTALTLT